MASKQLYLDEFGGQFCVPFRMRALAARLHQTGGRERKGGGMEGGPLDVITFPKFIPPVYYFPNGSRRFGASSS